MARSLHDIERCFQGAIPAALATCSADGQPNIVHISKVILVDGHHLAISNQFLDKTRANLASNPVATLLCPDPVSGASYKLLVRHERSEFDGDLFERTRLELEAVAAMTGMLDVFQLRSIDVFRVLDIADVALRGNTPAP